MVSTRKKRQSNKRLLSHLDDFDRDMIIGNAVSERQENAVVNEGTNDRDFTVSTSNNGPVVNGNAMSVKTLERCFNERIDREMSNIVDTVEDRIQNAILTAIEKIVAPKIELAIRSINASSGRDATSVSANSDRRERVEIIASFENASKNNNTLDALNVNDETRHDNPDEVSELSVPETHFDRQAHTHHSAVSHFSPFLLPAFLFLFELPICYCCGHDLRGEHWVLQAASMFLSRMLSTSGTLHLAAFLTMTDLSVTTSRRPDERWSGIDCFLFGCLQSFFQMFW